MNSGSHPGAWRPRQWVLATAIVLLGQVGLILWLGEKEPIKSRPPARVPALQIAASYDPELLALTDPSLLALPHPEGFSGMAWLKPRPLPPASFDWTEEPRWLTLQPTQLGNSLTAVLPNLQPATWVSAAMPEPELLIPRIEPLFDPGSPSRLSIHGGLAKWRFANSLNLPAWPPRAVTVNDTDVLTNTVLQVVINAEGRPISATLLSGSGSPAADTFALDQVRSARFERLQGSGTETDHIVSGPGGVLNQLEWGRLVFEWRTLPAASTNTAASSS